MTLHSIIGHTDLARTMRWIEQQIEEIVALTETIRAEFGALDIATMDLKPNAKTWSINGCFDHSETVELRSRAAVI